MRRGSICILTLSASLLWAGCNHSGALAPTPVVPAQPASGQPQPKLSTIKLWLGPKEVIAEQAVSPVQVQTGMMFRKQMEENEGMLFVFSRPMRVSFWMRNTLLPLSCAYIDSSGVILETHDMKPLDETPIEATSDQVQFVLEVKQGWFERNKIAPGTLVRTERGALGETYFGRP
jgi:uncharacterized protein